MTSQNIARNASGPRPEIGAGRGNDIHCRQFTASTVHAQLAAIEAPAGTWWISDADRMVLRKLINAAIAGIPEPGVKIELRDLRDEPEGPPWTVLDVQVGRIHYVVAISGWRPVRQVDAQELLASATQGWQAGVGIDDARSLLADWLNGGPRPSGEDLREAITALNEAEALTEAAAKFLGSDPTNWMNPIPENALIEALACRTAEAQG